MNEPGLIQGRYIGASQLEEIRRLMGDHRHWSRRRLSRELALLWQWRNPAGQLKDMAARTLMLKLHQRGWIVLPPRRRAAPQRMNRPARSKSLPVESRRLVEPLSRLLPLSLTELCTGGTASERSLFSALLCAHHYLGHRGHVGQNLQYLARDRQGRPLACALFGAPAWQCAPRDHYIGWDAQARGRHLHLMTNNTRFLLLPWVEVPRLASHLLSRIARRISQDWQRKYGHPIYLMESFVQCDRFPGTAYQAANWVCVGQTQGRSRQDQPDGAHNQVPIKDIYLYPLHSRFRQLLQGNGTSQSTTTPSEHPHNSWSEPPLPKTKGAALMFRCARPKNKHAGKSMRLCPRPPYSRPPWP